MVRRAVLVMLGLVLVMASYALGVRHAGVPDATPPVAGIPVAEIPVAGIPEGMAGANQPPADDLPGDPKTPLIRSLIRTLKTFGAVIPQAAAEVENSLHEGDEKLRDVLGENSKRLIMEANRKPLVPRIGFDFRPASGFGNPSILNSESTSSSLPVKVQTFPPSQPK